MPPDLIERCNWPELPDKYDTALRSAIGFVLENYHILGIIATGTIIRGTPDPTSDLDIYVIHDKPFRQRLQKFFNNVPVEIFINPPKAVEDYLRDEQKNRRPITAHMLSTGFVVLDRDPVIAELQTKAKEFLANPPATPTDLTPPRYLAALLFEDAVDKIDQDPETAEMILYTAVEAMLNFCFIQAGNFIPRKKSLLNELKNVNPDIAKLACHFFRSPNLKEKFEIASQIADNSIGAYGFFEWNSPQDEYSLD